MVVRLSAQTSYSFTKAEHQNFSSFYSTNLAASPQLSTPPVSIELADGMPIDARETPEQEIELAPGTGFSFRAASPMPPLYQTCVPSI